MYEKDVIWSDFKENIFDKGFICTYISKVDIPGQPYYEIIFSSQNILWKTIVNTVEDISDFETNYKNLCNLNAPQSTQDRSTSNFYASIGETIVDMNTRSEEHTSELQSR
jgi:hypothetical protein